MDRVLEKEAEEMSLHARPNVWSTRLAAVLAFAVDLDAGDLAWSVGPTGACQLQDTAAHGEFDAGGRHQAGHGARGPGVALIIGACAAHPVQEVGVSCGLCHGPDPEPLGPVHA